jgi:DNA-binding response OmpR family regulator
VELTAREYDLLRFLAVNAGKVFSRDSLLEKLWDYDFFGDARTVDVHIRHIREKIERNPGVPEYILTVRGVGYKFKENRL